jgi:hypothetical protein
MKTKEMNNRTDTMTAKGLFILIFFSFSALLSGQRVEPLRFRVDGTFKIVQFTDIHLTYNSPRSDSVIILIRTILEEEKPDLAIFTGDVVFSSNARLEWMQALQPVMDMKTPFAVTFGNHDDEFDMTRPQEIDLLSELPGNLTANGPDDIYGHCNYILNIGSSKSGDTRALIYCFDSNSYSTIEEVKGYGWIRFDQVGWYRQQSDILRKENNGIPLPALAFFHIPVPEYNDVIGQPTTLGLHKEGVSCPQINSGLFASMVEKGDVMGVFVGHDHDNNFIGIKNNICLAYGCKTGLDCYGSLPKGARIIVMYEGERKFKTWIRSLNDNPQFTAVFPDSFSVMESK